MILTITMNPAIDISYPLESLALNTTNRVKNDSKTAGGKGLNVSRVIHLLDENVTATGLLGGNIGSFIENRLTEEGIGHQFYHTDQESRICIAILHDRHQQTEILEGGPVFSSADEIAFLAHYRQIIKETDIKLITMSGSLPQGLPTTIYSQMIAIAGDHGINVLLDCSGQALQDSLAGEVKPYLIKPNEEEIQGIITGPSIETEEQLITALSNEQFIDVPWIVVSLGANGALAKVADQFYRVSIPKVDVVNPVGSGDATVAGLAVSIAKGQSVEEVLKTAMTTGILNALEKQTGFINPDHFSTYYKQVMVTNI